MVKALLLAQKSEFSGPVLGESDSPETILHSCLGLIRRQLLVILSCLFLVSAAGALYLLVTRPTYTAAATMLMDPRKGGVQQRSVLGDAPSDTAWIDSQ